MNGFRDWLINSRGYSEKEADGMIKALRWEDE